MVILNFSTSLNMMEVSSDWEGENLVEERLPLRCVGPCMSSTPNCIIEAPEVEGYSCFGWFWISKYGETAGEDSSHPHLFEGGKMTLQQNKMLAVNLGSCPAGEADVTRL